MARFSARSIQVLLVLCFAASNVFGGVPKRTDVVVVGAGLSGLATAHLLKKAGISFHIVELTPRIGGRVRTVHYKQPSGPELYADSGMEEYWESNPAVTLLKEFKLPLRADFAVSSMALGGKLEAIGLNESGEDYLKRVFTKKEYDALESFKTKVAPMVEKLTGSTAPEDMLGLKDVSFEDWLKKQGLPEKVRNWIRVSIECEVGTHWNRFSALDGLAEFHIFLGKGEQSYRVIGGNEKFTDAFVRSIGRSNISVNQRVTRVVSREDGVDVSVLDVETHENRVIHASQVVSTIPLFRLFEVQFDPPLSAKKRQAIQSQSWGSYFKAHVFVPKSVASHWTKGGQSILPILSDSDLGVIYEGNPDQETDTKILSLLVTGDAAERFNLMNLDDVRTQINASFDKLWPGFAKNIQGMEFYRFHPRAIAGWPVGRSRFDELSQEVRKPENHVYLAGDFTEGTHSSGAIASAYRVVKQITEERSAPKRAVTALLRR